MKHGEIRRAKTWRNALYGGIRQAFARENEESQQRPVHSLLLSSSEHMDASTASSRQANRRLATLASHLESNEGSGSHAVGLSSSATSHADFTRSTLNKSTIDIERSKARFNANELAYVIDGGKEKTEVRFE